MNMPLPAVAGDFKVHCSALTVGLRMEAENTKAVCVQTNQSSGGHWPER